MKSLPVRAQVYIYGLLVVAGMPVALALHAPPRDALSWLQIGFFSLAIVLADCFPIVLPSGDNVEETVATAIETAAVIVFGTEKAIIIIALGTLLGDVMLRKPWYKAGYNVAKITVTFAVVGIVYNWLSDGQHEPFFSFATAWAVSVIVVVHYFVDSLLMNCLVWLLTGMRFTYVWRSNLLIMMWSNLTLVVMGAIMAQLWLYRPWSILTLVFPIVVIRQAFQYYADLQRQTRDALIRMADAIDQRDPSTAQHSQRVSTLAQAIAQQMKIAPEEIDVIRTAGRLHDLGKIGMGNEMLYKPGALTEVEWAKFRQHPDIGADMIRSFSFFAAGQGLVRHHHERFDGKGYPLAIAGEDIPLGSRVLTVADSFDAMTSIRPYRSPVSTPDAVAELVRNSGMQFDPNVVQAFLQVLQRWGGEVPWRMREPPPSAAAGQPPQLESSMLGANP